MFKCIFSMNDLTQQHYYDIISEKKNVMKKSQLWGINFSASGVFIIFCILTLNKLTIYECRKIKFNVFSCFLIFMRPLLQNLPKIITENQLPIAELR